LSNENKDDKEYTENYIENDKTQQRKIEHINIVLNKDVQYHKRTTMFEYVKILPKSGEISIDDVDISTTLLNKKINTPLFASAITGGHTATFKINRDIAIAVERIGMAMGVGSQRAMIEKPDLKYTFDVKKVANNIILIGNIGAAQTLKYDNNEIQHMLDEVNADILAVHLNPAQESVQPEGDINLKGAYNRICEIAKSVKQPVIIKEVGNGVSKEVAEKFEKRVYGIDVEGAGGTTWVGVETYRSKGSYGNAFWDWGIPTALSLLEVKSVFSGSTWASGGVRTPTDIMKALALGADLCGMAKPVLEAQNRNGAEGVYHLFLNLSTGLKEEMAKLGYRSIKELAGAKVEINGVLAKLVKQRDLKLNKNIKLIL